MAALHLPEKIRQEIFEKRHDLRYKMGAYFFVLSGLEFYLTQLGEKRHIKGQELSLALLTFAHKQFGPMAASVFNYWGIKTTDDIGHIVYNLIEINVMTMLPEDRIEDFFDVADLGRYFANQESFEIDKEFIKKINGA